MTTLLAPLLERLSEHFPIPTMARALLERSFHPERLDAWFEQVAERQYTCRLLFSTLFGLMMQVVSRRQPSVHAACQGAEQPLGVSVKSVYNKLNALEPSTSAELVRYSGTQAQQVIEQLRDPQEGRLGPYRIKILDGNALAGREHRLKETREVSAAPLPGKALVIFDPALGIIQDLEPSEDAYTQERALLPQLLERVSAGELWIADRNFCTRAWLWGLHQRGALSLVREHQQIPIKPLEPLREVARRGGVAWAEQRVLIEAPDGEGTLELRRIRVSLDQPTREGETRLSLLTTVPAEVADAPTLAELYRTRWKLERAFLHLTQELRCEITTLAYPPAALFAFAMAIVAYNALAVVKIALRQVHGAAASDESLSGYYLVNEMARVGESLDTLVTTEEWAVFRHLSPAEMAQWLCATAERAQLRKYRKHPRGPKKPAVSRTRDPKRSHLSVARLLAKRNRN